MAHDSTHDVAIIGAGPVGLCLARALGQQGLRVALVERQAEAALAEPAFDGREIALTHGSLRLLGEQGVLAHIPAVLSTSPKTLSAAATPAGRQ